MCTHCRRKENGTVKNLKISTLPAVLIIHLKRFCQTKMSNSKLVYPVQFPLVGLDVRRFLSTKKNNEQINNDDSGADDDQPDFIDHHHQEKQYEFLYDLFAVCNHRGSMSNGHYTAYCKNPVTGKWFCYDDHLVSELDSSRVCTPDAYILFYRRRDISPSSSSEPITKSSSSQQQPIDSIVNDFDEQLTLDYPPPSSNLQPLTIENNFIRSSLKDKQHHYTLQPPLPLPRRFVTPLSPSPSQDDFSLVQPIPCPMPRARKPQYELEIASLPSQIFPPPSPPIRRQQMPPTVNYVYPISSTPLEHRVDPLHNFYSPTQRHNNNAERLNPWNRYNNQRYSDDEQERNVVYSKTILR
jgi:hypothetical protein